MAGRQGRDALWRVDLHSHTRFSVDSLTEPAALVAGARRAGLDRIAVTDHNTTEGAHIARRLAPDLVIVGEEINTAGGGELIAYYVREALPPGLPLDEALRRLRAQGAVISVSHPFDHLRSSAMGETLTRQIVDQVDALEVFNARCLSMGDNVRAATLAREHGKGLTAGSDGHTVRELGRGYVSLPPFEDNPASLLASLRQAEPGGRLSGVWPHFASAYARWRKRF
jgi:predicted metal-dependent phosphoesterase TrpH